MQKRYAVLVGLLFLMLGIMVGVFIAPKITSQTSEIPEVTNPIQGDKPKPVVHDGWETYTDTADGSSFMYPKNLGMTYLHPVMNEWPPKMVVINKDSFPCVATQIQQGEPRNSTIEKIVVSGREYCLVKMDEGAMGSVYTTYTYTRLDVLPMVSLTFTLQTPRCENYDDAQRLLCEQEQKSFDPNVLADQIVMTYAS